MPVDLTLYPESAQLGADGQLSVGGVSMDLLAEEFGTPAYVIDEGALRARAQRYREAFESLHADSLVLFASKSFPSAAITGLLAKEGIGTDVAAAGELLIALHGGAPASRMVFHGNAKTDVDVQTAMDAGVRYIVIDNLDDVERIARLASTPVPALLRVSPGVLASTHEKMMTGHDSSKFGIPSTMIDDTIARIRRESMIDLRGLHTHIGSGVTAIDQFEAAVEALGRMEKFQVYDLGGGLGVWAQTSS